MFSKVQLNWSSDDVAPYMSANTVHFHYEKHYAGYINKTNEIISTSSFVVKSLVDVIKNTKDKPLFNNAAQVWNHEFFWNSIARKGSTTLSGKIAELVYGDYGSEEAFFNEFKNKSTSHFGSGWTWLTLNPDKKLEIFTTSNADNPMTGRSVPLITLDLWEHAYYLDYKNDRASYVDNFLKHLINWDFANSNLKFIFG